MQTSITVGADTAMGAQPYTNSALTATAVLVAAAPGATPGIRPRVLYALVATNPDSARVYLQLFNAATAGAVTLGTTAPTLAIGVAAGASLALSVADVGVRFDAGIVVASTTTATGNTAPGTATVLNLIYA